MMNTPMGDSQARDRIRTDLTTNLLVEAGAGSGKTTALVARMLEHVRTGTPVDRIAAVTFTRKAANELRERFQVRLEAAVAEAAAGSEEGVRYAVALHGLDRTFLGTIHSFCGRLLRERPLEIGLDPNFQEVSEQEWEELTQRFWRRWVERTKRTDDPDLIALAMVGIDPQLLYEGFTQVMTYPDVSFDTGPSDAPDGAPCLNKLAELLASARRLMPAAEPPDGWDKLMRLVRRLEFRGRVDDWSELAPFCAVLEGIAASHCEVVQKRWSDTKEGKADAKELGSSFLAFLQGPAAELLRCWREHRYPVVMRFLKRASAEFARERHATGQLGFEDLLLLSARLLREHPAVREELGQRYAHLLVDEFQDTDPIQAEVCFLLASHPSEGADWTRVQLRPGSLFVVGDPKQSIYRFRRADIQVYEAVKRRMEQQGAVLALTRNFRSVEAVGELVNAHFAETFPAEATAEQAPYSPMETVAEARAGDGVYRYVAQPVGKRKEDVLETDAALVASWIGERIARDRRRPGDFLVLTTTRAPIECYARALGERNIPVSTTGARLPREYELNELLVVLRAVADPENPVLCAAALEGLFFGLSPADLWTARRSGLRFALTHPPAEGDTSAGHALAQLHAWWRVSQRHPADVLLERILDDTGLLVHAASETLGDARAGALLHLVEALRSASTGGASGITDAMEHLELLLGSEAADSPLRPGRTDAVRVMNLHKAKGLEGEVVILAAPLDQKLWDPRAHIWRDASGVAAGGLCIGYRDGQDYVDLAQPRGWADMQNLERGFAAAERDRLLYVAATRAKRELVVAQAEVPLKKGPRPDTSAWRPLGPKLEAHAAVLAMQETVPGGRLSLEVPATSLREATLRAAERLHAAATPSTEVRTVTELAKAHASPSAQPSASGLGVAWGRAVHRTIEALARGRRGDSLQAMVRAIARDEDLEEALSTELAALPARVLESDGWRWLCADGANPRSEQSVMRRGDADGVVRITEGVIDIVSLGPEGWRIVDWKTDRVDDEEWERRRVPYERQIGEYARMLTELTGIAAKARILRI